MTRYAPFLALAAAITAGAQETAVPLSPGVTPLGEIGIYRVAYQSYGGQVVALPVSWSGHFTDPSGISYVPSEWVLGRSAILLHSPWRVPPGKCWVDYRVKLPKVQPIQLAFGTAMGPDAIGQDKSDGVTFSAFLIDGGTTTELLREHRAEASWKDQTYDLSICAGSEVTIRLQVEPGPANNASFDFSYFGDARLMIGTTSSRQAARVAELVATKAARAADRADLRALANRPGADQGVTPSTLLPSRASAAKQGAGYRFTSTAADATIAYTWRPGNGTLDDWTAQIDDGPVWQPALGGGVTAALADGQTARCEGGQATQVTFDERLQQLTVTWAYPTAGGLTVRWVYGLKGKALTVAASCAEPRVAAFSLGHIGGVPLRKSLGVPYLSGAVDYLGADRVFVSRYLDWTRSQASSCPAGNATYHALTDGSRNLLAESGYLTVSPQFGDVLPNLPHPASPYLAQLGPRVMLDIWGHRGNSYAGDAALLRELKDHGVDHVAIIQHVWQRYGYDVKLPDHLPANPAFGGDPGMVEFGRAANECGYLWSLHENYIDLYPDAPSYDPTARVLRADGTPSPAWFNRGTGVQSYGLKCNRAKGYAAQVAPEAHRRFATTAAYLDVHTCVPPWHQLDHEAGQPQAGMALAKVKYDTALFQFMRDAHQGPLFGEGANHFYWAGRCDGVEAQVHGGEDHAPLLDFDLLKLHPQMVNHGMGYYERWFRQGYNARFGGNVGTVEQVDKYRAQELAYGHAGFIGAAQTANVHWVVKEHHLMHPVQRLYGTAKVTDVRYEVDGRLVPASIALAVGDTWRQRLRYDSGLTLYVNWAAEPWKVAGHTLPQWGWLAEGPDTVATTCRQGDRLADFVDCPEYLFADARTFFNMPYTAAPKNVEPRLKSLRHLGGNRLEVTYEWVIGEALDADYQCFVHGCNDADETNGGIVFQQDHALPRPTSTWRAGETLTDGPYVIEVPDQYDTYDLVIGLYKTGRVPLKGLSAGGDRILLARLQLQKTDGKVTAITTAPLDALRAAAEAGRPDFTANLNPAGTMIDFGALATDGSVKVNRGARELIVFPYPRDRAFTVKLDLAKIVKANAPRVAQVTVRALAALTQADLGPVPATTENGRLVFTTATKGAGRYRITW